MIWLIWCIGCGSGCSDVDLDVLMDLGALYKQIHQIIQNRFMIGCVISASWVSKGGRFCWFVTIPCQAHIPFPTPHPSQTISSSKKRVLVKPLLKPDGEARNRDLDLAPFMTNAWCWAVNAENICLEYLLVARSTWRTPEFVLATSSRIQNLG